MIVKRFVKIRMPMITSNAPGRQLNHVVVLPDSRESGEEPIDCQRSGEERNRKAE